MFSIIGIVILFITYNSIRLITVVVPKADHQANPSTTLFPVEEAAPISISSTSSLDSTITEGSPYQTLTATLINGKSLTIINGSFLHNPSRNYYGNKAPSRLVEIWKHKLGSGTTKIGPKEVKWRGAGWTGQPLLIKENNTKYLLQGAYDHHLKKIDAATGKLVWQYKFDDVIKGTGSIWLQPNADSIHHSCLILQGSRAGKSIYSSYVPSYRAVSYWTGEECWRMDSHRTDCYSRDVDASCLLLNDTAYIGLENGIFTVFNPAPDSALMLHDMLQPQIYTNRDTLYTTKDKKEHRGNLVTEASPVLLGNHIYIASGSGHIWGYNLQTKKIDWDFYTGSDIDGTPTITEDKCLLVAIEKQYIKGKGGLLKLDPRKEGIAAIEWFLPIENRNFQSWEGGIIGSPSTNLNYPIENAPNLAAVIGIDGFLYVVDTDYIADTTTSFDGKTIVPKPKIVFKYKTGPSISTPLIVQNKIIAATYKGTYLFEYDALLHFKLLDKIKIKSESTPFVDDEKIYLPSRNGYLYCLGNPTYQE
jgi:outer membrane protein assembly factor BamB